MAGTLLVATDGLLKCAAARKLVAFAKHTTLEDAATSLVEADANSSPWPSP